MKKPLRVMLLAGSAEAHALADPLMAEVAAVIAVLSEPERSFPDFPCRTETGSLTDPAALEGFLDRFQISCILDAGHGFDAVQSAATATRAAAKGLPYARVLRPVWSVEPPARRAKDVAAAAGMIRHGARVFATTGRASLADFAPFAGACLLLRQTTDNGRSALPDFVQPVLGSPPFTQEQEAALFAELRIDTLICRNVGGLPSRPKLDAALAMGLETIVIDRPAPPAGIPCFATPDAALAWVRSL